MRLRVESWQQHTFGGKDLLPTYLVAIRDFDANQVV